MSRFVHLACILVVALLSFSSALAAIPEPDGKYCGSYMMGLVKGSVRMYKPHRFDLDIKAFESTIDCTGVEYAMNPSAEDKHDNMHVPSASDHKSCLGAVLNDNGLSLKVGYIAADNVVTLDLGVAKIKLSAC